MFMSTCSIMNAVLMISRTHTNHLHLMREVANATSTSVSHVSYSTDNIRHVDSTCAIQIQDNGIFEFRSVVRATSTFYNDGKRADNFRSHGIVIHILC